MSAQTIVDPPQDPPSSTRPPRRRSGRLALLAVALGFASLVGFVLTREDPASDHAEMLASRRLVDFNLTSARGEAVTRADLDGHYLVVNFVHSSCSFDCRRVNDRMAEIQKLVADQADVRLVSLTVDPRTDTPGVLARFAAEFGAQFDRWMFLTGDKPTLYFLLETSFLRRGEANPVEPIPGGFLDVDRIALVDPRGVVRQYFPGLSLTTPTAVVDSIERLRQEST